MSGIDLFFLHLGKIGFLAILVGLFVRHRAHVCWSFVGYISWALSCNALISFWPDHFYTKWFYQVMQAGMDAMKLAIAAELSYRTFRAFPGAAARVRLALAPLFLVPALFVTRVPAGTNFDDWVQLYQPQVQTGIIWIITAITLLIAWYRVPVHALHRAILIGFAAYLLIFTTLLNVFRDFGFHELRNFINAADNSAYMFLLLGWCYAAWVTARQPVLSLNVMKRLHLETV